MALINPWEPPARIEDGYRKAIEAGILAFQPQIAAAGSLAAALTALEAFGQSETFRLFARAVAAKMVTNTLSWSAKTWRDAAREMSKGQQIYNATRSEIDGLLKNEIEWQIMRNAQLISSLPQEIRQNVDGIISRMTIEGSRPETIEKEILKYFPETTAKRAKLVARTEAAKTHTARIRSRAESLGITWYIWHSTNDVRTRRTHRLMNGVLCQWSDPPSPEALAGERTVGNYAPGEIWNCRCYPQPVTNINRVSWPHKVYYNGSIQTMTLAQFRQIGGMAA